MAIGIWKPAILAASALWLLASNASLDAPRLGFVRLPGEGVLPLRGVAGAFYYGDRINSGNPLDLAGFAFNGRIGIRLHSDGRSELLGPNGEVTRTARIDGAVRAYALSAIEDSAYVWTERELWRITANGADLFAAPELAEGSRLVGFSGAGPYVDIASAQTGQVTVHRLWYESGQALMREAFSAEPANLLFLDHEMTIWTEDGAVVLRRPDGSALRVDATVSGRLVSLHEAGKGWFHAISDDGSMYALEVTGDPKIPATIELRLLALPARPKADSAS